MPLVNFYRGSYTSAQLLTLCQTAGNIVFDNNTGRIYAGTTTVGGNTVPKIYGSNVVDASFTNNVLTITRLDSEHPVTLDFSDVASAKSLMAVFEQLRSFMGMSAGAQETAPDYSSDTTGILYNSTTHTANAGSLTAADLALATATAGKVSDVKIGNTSIVDANKVANITTDGTYNASSNKIATQTTVSNAIDALDVTAYAQAAIDTTAVPGETTLNIKGISETNGAISADTNTSVDLVIDGTYDAAENKIATQSTVADVINGLDSVADADDTSAQTGHATITTSTPSADFKVLNSITETDGKLTAADAYNLKKVAATAESEDLLKSTNSGAVYDTTASEIDSTWVSVVTGNALADGDTVDADLNKLDNKIAGLADQLIRNEQVIQETFSTISDSVGLENDFSLDLRTATGVINSDTDVKSALIDLADAIVDMDGTATIASKSGNVITLKTGVEQTNGEISNDSGSDIVLADVAATGAAADITITDSNSHYTTDNVDAALNQLAAEISALSGSFDVIKSVDAATTPYGVTWDNAGTTVTGILAASADTFHKIYLVPASGGTSPNSYDEYITTKDSSTTPVSYAWERLGTIDVDLTGYAKSVTVNGKTYTTPNNSTDVNIGDVITSITGETEILTGANSDLVSVKATTVKNSTNGTNATTLASKVKVEEVADGLTKDSTASYTTGHYVIENGKLVSAVGKSGVDTYTISANDGLTTASDVKAYVDSSIENARLTWAQWS